MLYFVAALLILLAMIYMPGKKAMEFFPVIEIPATAKVWKYSGLTAYEMTNRINCQAEN